MTITRSEEVLDFEKFVLRRAQHDGRWVVDWKTTGLIEYLDTGGRTHGVFIAEALANRLEGVAKYMENQA